MLNEWNWNRRLSFQNLSSTRCTSRPWTICPLMTTVATSSLKWIFTWRTVLLLLVRYADLQCTKSWYRPDICLRLPSKSTRAVITNNYRLLSLKKVNKTLLDLTRKYSFDSCWLINTWSDGGEVRTRVTCDVWLVHLFQNGRPQLLLWSSRINILF